MSGFDHHAPDIEQLMWDRARQQGDALVAADPRVARHHERRDRGAVVTFIANTERLRDAFAKLADVANDVVGAWRDIDPDVRRSAHFWPDTPGGSPR